MKHLKLLIAILSMISISVLGQTTVEVQKLESYKLEGNSKIYKTWVKPLDSSKKIYGYLRETKDNQLVISRFSDFEEQHIHLRNVKNVKFREEGKIGKGILLGALTGFLVGGIIGIADGDDEPGWLSLSAETKALIVGTHFLIPGGLIGGIIGSFKIKVPINSQTYNK